VKGELSEMQSADELCQLRVVGNWEAL